MIPNYQSVVEDLAARYPQEWHDAHRPSGGGPHTEAFIRRLAWELHQRDPRIGLCGKRGNPSDISDDALVVDGVSVLGDVDPTRGNVPVTVIDVIIGAGGDNPRASWGAAGPATPRPHAAWVKPQPVAGSVAPPPAPSEYFGPAHYAIVSRLGAADVLTIAQQFQHSFPGEGWWLKRAGAGRPISGDTIARPTPGGLFGVRVTPAVKVWGALPGQELALGLNDPKPTAVNHLGDVPAPVEPPKPVEPPPAEPVAPAVDYGPRFDMLDANVGELMAMVTRLSATASAMQATIDDLKSQEFVINWRTGAITQRAK